MVSEDLAILLPERATLAPLGATNTPQTAWQRGQWPAGRGQTVGPGLASPRWRPAVSPTDSRSTRLRLCGSDATQCIRSRAGTLTWDSGGSITRRWRRGAPRLTVFERIGLNGLVFGDWHVDDETGIATAERAAACQRLCRSLPAFWMLCWPHG